MDCEGRSGGLALFWKEDVDLIVLSYSRYHIHAKVMTSNNFGWYVTGIYGQPEVSRRRERWDWIKKIYNELEDPWLLCGEFNEIVSKEEKRGGNLRPKNQLDQYRNFIDYCY